MAIITLAIDENTKKPVIYDTEDAVRGVINYTINKSKFSSFRNLTPFGMDANCIANQMIFIQRCRYKPMANRIIHLVMSFATADYEEFINKNNLDQIMYWVVELYFHKCQRFVCMHTDNPSHLHLHYIINPIDLENYSVVRYSLVSLIQDMSRWLCEDYGIAVQGMTYFNGSGKLCRGSEGGVMLYQNKYCQKYGLDVRGCI